MSLLTLLLACTAPAPRQPAVAPPPAAVKKAEAPRAARPDAQKTVLDVALGSADHTTLVAAVKAADLVAALDSPGGIYTVFAPTNAAFDALPAGTVDGLLEPGRKAELRKVVQHHAAVPIVPLANMREGETLTMADGSKVTFHRDGDKVKVDGATILGSVNAVNGVVYVVDQVILPPA
jgi:uncharacterized surface protein with fasciclin (FAS1) repeats